jgi:alpha-L-rhamnosidase
MSDAAGAAGWADAATVIPWNLYLAYGDKTILSTQYNSMARWVAYQQSRAGEDLIWSGDFQFGDWLDYFSTSKNTSFGSTPDDLIATAYFAHSVDLLQRSAVVLGKSQDATRYADLLAKIRAAFNKQFVTADGRVGGGTQTAYVLALDFDLLPEAVRPLAAKRLAEDVRAQKHLTTGFLGTPHLLNVLSRFGYVDEAYQLLNRREFPSWLYPVTHGATTIWERWDGLRPDGTFQSVSMNSFNHYAYGAVGEWMYRVMAGINPDPAAPGYKHSVIEPVPGGGFTQVSASLETRYGKLSSAWEIKDHQLTLTVEVPPNTRATVRLPHAPPDRTVVEVGSGKHTFTAPRPR